MTTLDKHMTWIAFAYLTAISMWGLFINIITCWISLIVYILPAIISLLIFYTYPIIIFKGSEEYHGYWKDMLDIQDMVIVSFTALANIMLIYNTIKNKSHSIPIDMVMGDWKYVDKKIDDFFKTQT